MSKLTLDIAAYKKQLDNGQIQRAYRGILSFMSSLKTYLNQDYPDYTAGALYPGYMDMSYFSFTPPELKRKKLKLAIVYLHEKGIFEIWLSANNRKIQADYIRQLQGKNIKGYKLSEVCPGVDSIIESILVEQPDFDRPDDLKAQIKNNTLKFSDDVISILSALNL